MEENVIRSIILEPSTIYTNQKFKIKIKIKIDNKINTEDGKILNTEDNHILIME